MDDRWRLEEFSRLLDISKRVVVFTGAGISTESGIPEEEIIELHGNSTMRRVWPAGSGMNLIP